MSYKEKIIDESFRLFMLNSPKNVTIGQICEACGITRPTFYKVFKNKEELFTFFYRRMTDDILRDMVSIVQQDTYLGQVWHIFDCFTIYIMDLGVEFVSEMIIANMINNAKSFEIISDLQNAAERLIKKALDEGQIKNTSNPARLYAALCRYFDGCIEYWCSHNGEHNVRDEIRKGFEDILDVTPAYRKF